jgi:D-serine deaminase-like pyridoxal phosphate-dependent protein
MTFASFPIEDLDTPAILIDREIMQQNIVRMQALVDQYQLALRPHVKTHKSVALAKRQLLAGATGIAVAKLSEAEVMARGGIEDIQIANQIVGRQKIERMAALAAKVNLSCAVDSEQNLRQISEIFSTHGMTANLFIEIDCGLHRAGLADHTQVLALTKLMQSLPSVRLVGLLTHAGHAYASRTAAQLEQIGREEGELMVSMADHLRRDGIEVPSVSVGSTPTAQFAASVPGVTELRVGNYLFNDAIQVSLGVAQWDQCALTILSTVTSVQEGRFVLDAGSKVFSSDSGAHGSNLLSGYGQILGLLKTVTRLSEEHAVVVTDTPTGLSVGERVRVIPNHACPVTNLAECAWLIDSGRVVEEIQIDARAMTS